MCSSRADSCSEMRVTGMPVHIATTSAISSSPTDGWSPETCVCHSARSSSTRSLAVASASRSVAASSYSWLLIAASFSFVIRSSSFCATRSSGGADEWRRRTRLEASSMRSMALSGRWRSVM